MTRRLPARLTAARASTLTTIQATMTLTAEAVDMAARTIAGMLVPYGVVGATSAGPIVVEAGSLETYEDLTRLKLFSGHNRENPIAYCTDLDFEGEQAGVPGVVGTFKVAATIAGDLALLEASEHVRDAFSVELDTLTVSENLDDPAEPLIVTSGFLRANALVTIPAFDDARVSAVAATHNNPGRQPMDPCSICGHDHEASVSCRDHAATLTAGQTPAPAPTSPAITTAPVVAPASAPGAEAAQVTPATPARPSDRFGSLRDLCAALAQRSMGNLPAELQAALSDITYTAVGGDADRGQWVGELWGGVAYKRKIVPLVQHDTLTSLKVNGWSWGTKPAMAAYAGDKANVPSNAVTANPVSSNASRLAGAHDIDRAMVDFENPDFWDGYYKAMAESYARLTDAALVDALEAGATDVAEPGVEGFLAAVAAGVGSLETEVGADSTFVIANLADLTAWVLGTTMLDLPARLDLIGVDIDRIVYHSSLTAGTVLVGTREAATFRELGETPIRVQAVDMAKGGVDPGCFGYYHVQINDAGGLAQVPINEGA